MIRPGFVFLAVLASGCASHRLPVELELTTWSIAALDPATGDVGVALASCVPEAHADAVAALVPNTGVAVTQALWNLENRDRVYRSLIDGLPADDIIERVTNPELDADVPHRQYGIVTLSADEVRIAGFTGDSAPAWSGIRYDLDMAVSVQGNTLVGEAVVADALEAFVEESPNGENDFTDRLMRALEAGSAAGGDIRCNRDGISSTAATAVILAARGGDSPYAAANIRLTDQGTDQAPWLAISEARPLAGPSPIPEVRRRYDQWRANR